MSLIKSPPKDDPQTKKKRKKKRSKLRENSKKRKKDRKAKTAGEDSGLSATEGGDPAEGAGPETKKTDSSPEASVPAQPNNMAQSRASVPATPADLKTNNKYSSFPGALPGNTTAGAPTILDLHTTHRVISTPLVHERYGSILQQTAGEDEKLIPGDYKKDCKKDCKQACTVCCGFCCCCGCCPAHRPFFLAFAIGLLATFIYQAWPELMGADILERKWDMVFVTENWYPMVEGHQPVKVYNSNWVTVTADSVNLTMWYGEVQRIGWIYLDQPVHFPYRSTKVIELEIFIDNAVSLDVFLKLFEDCFSNGLSTGTVEVKINGTIDGKWSGLPFSYAYPQTTEEVECLASFQDATGFG